MTPRTVAALAGLSKALAEVAAAFQVEATAPEQPSRVKLSVAAKRSGIPTSTLSELIRRKEITAARVGVGRGHYLVDPSEIERYLKRRTEPARAPVFREVANH